MSKQQFRVTAPVTLNGEPAGPDLENYLAFVEGDIVEILDETPWSTGSGVVVARKVDSTDSDQELDARSLVAI